MPASPSRLAGAAGIVVLAAVYYLTARVGLSLGVVEQVTAVWPPTGIAIGATVLLGPRAWPGVWLGALAANVAASEPLGTALGIATGNTLEALGAAWLLKRVGFDRALQRLGDVLALVLLGACTATTVSATIGVSSLALGGVHPWSRFGELWSVWWLGDAMGALLIAPVILTSRLWLDVAWRPARLAEFLLVFAGMVETSRLVFTGRFVEAAHLQPLAFVVFPFVIWMALRFGSHATAVAVLFASLVATGGTAGGLGPFGSAPGNTWVYLQVFMAVVAITGLMLAAAISERDRTERLRQTEYAVTKVLAECASLQEATQRVIQSICELFDFDLGALWTVDREHGVLRCVDLWHRPLVVVPEFVEASRTLSFQPGVGLPGRVWATRRPAWIRDVVEDANFPRAPSAAREGLHGAFGFPIVLAGEVLGVLEFFSHAIRQPDDRLLQLLTTTGAQIGQYIERRLAEEAVRGSETRKAGVLASVLDAIVTIDHEGRLLEFNAGAERIFGRSTADVLGKELAELIVPERLRAAHRGALARYVATGKASMLDRRLEMPAMRADGSEFMAELTIRRVAGSVPPMLTGYLRDITERKRAEEERARLLAGEQEARARAETLAADLRAQQAAKDQFLATLAHELRNPLAPLRNSIELLRRVGGSGADAKRIQEVMERQLHHLVRLVDDLLELARINRGQIELRRSRVDLADVLRSAVETIQPAIDAAGHQLEVELPPGPLVLDGDPVRLAQVFANLLDNATKYTDGHGRIRLAARVTRSGAGQEVAVSVRDTGIGIAEEMLPHVFDRFTRVERAGSHPKTGLGIGLTLVQRLVQLHGGRVEARSAGLGRGSEFVVHLGLAAAPAAPDEHEPPSNAPFASALRVLVVDDNSDAADSTGMLLGALGADVRVVYDGPAALRAFEEYRPDTVILDVGMPGMDGNEVARRIRALAGAGEVKLIALTGWGQAEDRQRSRLAGFDHYLVKPLDLGRLRAILEDAADPRHEPTTGSELA